MANSLSKIKLRDVYFDLVDSGARLSIGTKQDKLVSGTNIKTINGVSILGTGDITIGGGGSAYTNGYGISIVNGEIGIDTTIVAEKSNIPSVPTVVSAFTNDVGYCTQAYVDTLIGDINTVLDRINGEVI